MSITIAPYIDLGWHTVPLTGQLQRLEDGSKTIPTFEKDWRKKYQEEFNKKEAKLGGAITGKCSGIIAIDCDNPVTWNLFRSLDPDYEFVFLSKGKYDEETGTLIYAYTDDLSDSFGINDGELALDFYSNAGFVYLPTRSNRTKLPLDAPLPDIQPMPAATLVLLRQLSTRVAPTVEKAVSSNIMTANCLAPLVEQLCKEKKYMPGLFRIITPRDFRELPQYVENGYLHPEDIPAGRGSEYLSKVSAILGADLSIDEELYVDAMCYINKLFTEPMPESRLDKTILDPMTEGKASINGQPIWQYDEDWKKYRLILQSKRQVNYELCFDDRRNTYYVVDALNEQIRAFSRDSELMAYLEAAVISVPKKIDVKRSLPIAQVVTQPNSSFGFNESEDPTVRNLNTFVQTPELAVFNNPDAYATKYKEPKTILKYLETLVPEHDMRNYLLSFVHTKLATFKYSPVYLFFLGVHGSGKDLFVGILEQIMGRVAKPTTREFLEMFNGWIVDNYFAQLDEYGNQLTTVRDREEALGKIKSYTGKQSVQIRQMRTDGFQYQHNLTFIMTANKNPLGIEDGDRRCCLLNTPNVLAAQDWVIDGGGVSAVCDKIRSEIMDFCYYLATEIKPLTADQYVMPPQSETKHKLIADSMHAAGKLAYCLKHNMRDYLVDLAEEYGEDEFVTAVKCNNLTTIELFDLYGNMTEGRGDERSLLKVIRNAGIQVQPTTNDGKKSYRVRFTEK